MYRPNRLHMAPMSPNPPWKNLSFAIILEDSSMGFAKASMIRGSEFRPGEALEFPENHRSRRPRPSEYVGMGWSRNHRNLDVQTRVPGGYPYPNEGIKHCPPCPRPCWGESIKVGRTIIDYPIILSDHHNAPLKITMDHETPRVTMGKMKIPCSSSSYVKDSKSKGNKTTLKIG